MDKLKMHSPNLTEDNIARIGEIFPGCVTEAQGEDGSLRLAVDFDQLKQELSSALVEGPQERYHLNWPGKREALLTANAPLAKTLRPVRAESVDFDTTKNLYIEGDNLDALKLLQETYLGKVKMIYIDPPYNTGRDFIYNDDFSEDSERYLTSSNQQDAQGSRLVANTEANGRFHSDWLSMIYARLKLANNLLREDGLIFMSIDDNEQANLRRVCDEVFGEANFFGQFTWETKRAARGVPPTTLLMTNHEYVICYARNMSQARLRGLARDPADFANPDNDPRGLWRSESMKATGAQNNYFTIKNPANGMEFYANWAFSESTIFRMLDEHLVLFPNDPDGTPRQKKFMDSYTNETKAATTALGWHSTETSTKQLMEVFDGKKIFDFPKPLSLIEFFCDQVLSSGETVLDFFSGSGTTAHAVLKLNSQDAGDRRFIMVQLPEACSKQSEARKQGYDTITQVGKERIRRAGKVFADAVNGNMDSGFRVLKIDTSNMADVYYAPDALEKGKLDFFVDNIKPDRTSEDLLFQVMLDWGVDLALPIEKKAIQGKDVFFVDGNALAACFDARGGVDEAFVKELATHKPLRVVFRDAGFKDSAVKINVEQIFKSLSPSTEVKSI